MIEWKKCTLADLGEIVGGATPSTKDEANYGGDIAWITPKDLSLLKGRFIAHGERNISEKGLSSCSAKMMPKNSVLFSSRAPIGYVAISAGPVCTNQGFKSIVPNANTDYMFLYYLLRYKKDAIEAMGSGTTFKEVSASTMRSVEVHVPVEKKEQERISSVLSAIDAKIEANDRINDNLAETLQALYQHRYGATSQSTTCGTLASICGYSKAKVAVSALTTANYYSTENMLPSKAGSVFAASLPPGEQTTKCVPGDVLVSNIRPYFKKIVYCSTDCGCSPDVLCFTPKKPALSAYLYCTLYADHFFDFMMVGSKGAKMPRGDKQQIMTYAVHVPTEQELLEFNGVAYPILAQIESLRQENLRLSSLRDTLLPKLMSGEMNLSEIQF